MGDGPGSGGAPSAGGKGGKGPAKPKKPKLPEGAPAEVKDFVDCKGDRVELASGPVNWMPLPKFAEKAEAKPSATFEQGTVEGTIKATLGVGFVTVTITLSVVDGKLQADTSQVPGFTGLGPEITKWVDALNAWLAHNKKKLGAPTLKDGKVTLTKEAVAAQGAMVPAAPGVKARPGGAALVGAGMLAFGGLGLGVAFMDAGDSTTTQQITVTVDDETGGAGGPGGDPSGDSGSDSGGEGGSGQPDGGGGGEGVGGQGGESEGGGIGEEPVAPPAVPEVHDGAFCLEHGTGSSAFRFAWTMSPQFDGSYTVALAQSPTGPVSGTGTVTSGAGAADVQIFQFGPYDQLTITAPDGTVIPLGPLANAFPYTVGPETIDCSNLTGLEVAPAPEPQPEPEPDPDTPVDDGGGSSDGGSSGGDPADGGGSGAEPGTGGDGGESATQTVTQTVTTNSPPWSLLFIPAGLAAGGGLLWADREARQRQRLTEQLYWNVGGTGDGGVRYDSPTHAGFTLSGAAADDAAASSTEEVGLSGMRYDAPTEAGFRTPEAGWTDDDVDPSIF
jgi:hypothetical protein